MDPVVLFGLTPLQEEIAADPWKWYTFQRYTVPVITYFAPWLVVLAAGAVAALVQWCRHPVVARRVLLGCVGLLLICLARVSMFWVWTILNPNPTYPSQPIYSPVVAWVFHGLTTLVELGCLWLLVSAVWHGRGRRPEGGDE